MSGKVFHVSDDVHAAVKAWCRANGQASKQWVEEVLRAELKRVGASPSIVAVVPAHRPDPAPVEKKSHPEPPLSREDTPWSRPPFWEEEKEPA